MSENTQLKTESIKEVFKAMDKLSQRPFEYFVSGMGFILVLVGLFFHPLKSITQGELWAISVFGGISVISGLIVAIKKSDYTLRTNIEKIEYKKFIANQKTKRLQATNVSESEADLSDLELY